MTEGKPREFYFAKDSVHNYVRSSEVDKYPNAFLCLVRKSEYDQLQSENERLKKRCGKLRKALEFYADKGNYGSDDYSRHDGFKCFDVVLHDFSQSNLKKQERYAGSRARKALADDGGGE